MLQVQSVATPVLITAVIEYDQICDSHDEIRKTHQLLQIGICKLGRFICLFDNEFVCLSVWLRRRGSIIKLLSTRLFIYLIGKKVIGHNFSSYNIFVTKSKSRATKTQQIPSHKRHLLRSQRNDSGQSICKRPTSNAGISENKFLKLETSNVVKGFRGCIP